MEGAYVYAAAEGRSKPRERRQSRIRTSFFGSNKHGRADLSPDKAERSPSRLTMNGAEDGEGDSFFDRRRLRKAGSKISLRSMPSMPIVENPHEERTGYKSLSDLLRGGRTPYAPRRNPISKPFNFSHITHANSQDFNRLHQAPQKELLADFDKVVRDSSLPLRRRATTTEFEDIPQPLATSPPWTSRQRSSSFQTISERRRAGSNKSISPSESFSEFTMAAAASSSDVVRYACPLTPPLRTSSRHFLRSLQESPAEDGPDEGGREEVIMPYAVATDSSYGARSPGVETEFVVPAPVTLALGDEHERAELRAYRSAPDMSNVRQRNLRSPRCRPLSQLSQASDTLNGSFTVPSTPSQPMSGCRASSQLSVLMFASGEASSSDLDSCLDSWEEDIDWCYENQVDADCEFDWEECGLQVAEEVAPGCNEASDLPMPLRESPFRSDQFKKSDSKEQFVFVDKRLTGTFEDKLLLPPTPRMSFIPPRQYEPVAATAAIGVADGGFEPDHETIILRAADTALRHRSLSTSTSLQDMAPGRAYRDELARVARKLDEHIAALNMDMPISPPPPPTSSSPSFRPPPLVPSPSPLLGGRARADSQATCVTLCSDSETVTPTDSVEIVTPCSSAHSSVHMLQFLGRAEKGLSFAAAALPGVVEFGPDGMVDGVPDEFVHFI